jgi:hypothetical protein
VSPHTGRSITHAAGAIIEIDSVTIKRALSIVAILIGLMTIAVRAWRRSSRRPMTG